MQYQEVIDNITDVMEELDGEQIAEIYNQICSGNIEYIEDSVWKEIEKVDVEV